MITLAFSYFLFYRRMEILNQDIYNTTVQLNTMVRPPGIVLFSCMVDVWKIFSAG